MEILGFPFSDVLLTELAHVGLDGIQQAPAQYLLVIESHAETLQGSFIAHLQHLGTNVTYQHLPDPRLWSWVEGVSQVLVSPRILQAVVAWMVERYS